MSRVSVLGLSCGVLLAHAALAIGCGPDARLTYAEESVRVSARALAEAETSGGESPTLRAPLAEVTELLAAVERALEVWRDHSGPLAYRTRAPCLRAALLALRTAMLAASLSVPTSLDEADALLAEVGGRCTRRP